MFLSLKLKKSEEKKFEIKKHLWGENIFLNIQFTSIQNLFFSQLVSDFLRLLRPNCEHLWVKTFFEHPIQLNSKPIFSQLVSDFFSDSSARTATLEQLNSSKKIFSKKFQLRLPLRCFTLTDEDVDDMAKSLKLTPEEIRDLKEPPTPAQMEALNNAARPPV